MQQLLKPKTAKKCHVSADIARLRNMLPAFGRVPCAVVIDRHRAFSTEATYGPGWIGNFGVGTRLLLSICTATPLWLDVLMEDGVSE